MKKALIALGLAASLCGCAPVHIDPNAGAETVYLHTIDHADQFDIEYLRKPEQGPLRFEHNAWTLFWFVPLNHPDLGVWLMNNLPPDAEAANVRAKVKTPWYGPLLFFPTIGLVKVDRVYFELQPVIYKKIKPEEPKPVTPKTAPI
ncbi:hypothetical protein BH09SUM1_BH09SUM1_07920 [soil metagenome]